MMISRRLFTGMGLSSFAALGQDAPRKMTAREVIDRIIKETGATPPPNTVDTIKAGDPATPVIGIATTFMATLDVIKKASASGKNLVISHEPTFYSHLDSTAPLESDAVFQEKRDFIVKHNMVVWRFHDLWHMRRPDGILAGMVEALGWKAKQNPQQPSRFTFPETTLDNLASGIKEKMGIRNMRVVGDPNMRFTKVALMPGAAGGARQIKTLEDPNVEVLVIGETPEWEAVPYVKDAVSEGKHKALVIMGHVPSEEAGMDECARWLKTFLPGLPVEFIPAGEPFWTPR